MSRKSILVLSIFVGSVLIILALTQPAAAQRAVGLSDIELLGKNLYFDKNLSKNANQSCASCHDPAWGWTGPDAAINAHGAVYEGSVDGLFGNRKPPSAAYAGDSPNLFYDQAADAWFGGMFWDGRATGEILGDPLAEQAKGPFLNPLEQALASAEELCQKVAAGSYGSQFEKVWGTGSLDCAAAGTVYDRIGISIAAYERSDEVNSYTSKFDLFWDTAKKKRLDVTKITLNNWTKYRGKGLNDTEVYGLAMFNDPNSANCASCHSLQPGSRGYPLFTDYGYDNLGVPRNLENPFYTNVEYNPEGNAWIDLGLGGFNNDPSQDGKMKVPTLRNVDKRPSSSFVKAYMHNGSLKSLTDVVRFYHFRSMDGMMGGGGMGGGGMGGGGMGGGGMMFDEPEVNTNLASLNMFRGMDQGYLVAFLRTLSDGYFQR